MDQTLITVLRYSITYYQKDLFICAQYANKHKATALHKTYWLPCLTYNKDKPKKWAIKLFEVADSKNGYVCGFDIHCGKNETSCGKNAQVMDPDCTQMTRTVVGLLDSVQLLGRVILSTLIISTILIN